MRKPSWRHDGVTGFVVHCTADLKKVVAVHRLPWASAALTSAAVGPDGYALLLDLPAARPLSRPSAEPLAPVDGPRRKPTHPLACQDSQ